LYKLLRDSPSKNFFPTSRLTQEREKLSKDELPTRFAVEFFFVLRVAQVKKAKDFCSDELHTRARTWKPSSPQGLVCRQKKGDVRKKRRRPRKVVCRHKRAREKEEKKKTKEGEKVAPAKARFRVPSNKNFFFWFTSIWVWKRPVSYEVSDPTEVPETDYLTQRKQYLKRTTLSRLKIPLRSIRSEEGPHYRLGAKRERESCQRQATINLFFTSWVSFLIPTWAALRSLADARKCQLKDFCEKDRYVSCPVQRTCTADAFRKVRIGEN
jgi:hypothetical protein